MKLLTRGSALTAFPLTGVRHVKTSLLGRNLPVTKQIVAAAMALGNPVSARRWQTELGD
ncbi:hypothetical protein [Blastococcus sp. SYSU DS0619]